MSFDQVPGFGKIGAFLLIIGAVLAIMWFADRTRVIAISFVPFHQVILGFVFLLGLIMLATKRILGSSESE